MAVTIFWIKSGIAGRSKGLLQSINLLLTVLQGAKLLGGPTVALFAPMIIKKVHCNKLYKFNAFAFHILKNIIIMTNSKLMTPVPRLAYPPFTTEARRVQVFMLEDCLTTSMWQLWQRLEYSR
ncbi:hypothetical protein BY996DRAFT_6417388 [Phakopsora pachyrhizi]|nr:hypothetical protein BY996DRAFT_6417388 [Phakopsora pachyrhizi]